MKSENPTAIDIVAPDANAEALRGRRGWIISDGVAGHLAITRGIAQTLGLASEVKPVAARALWRHLAPFGPADPRQLTALLAKPLPEIVLGAGRQTVPFVRALKRAGAFAVLFQSPRAGLSSADLIWAPTHDGLVGPNVIATPTPPHRFTAQALHALRETIPPDIAALPSPRVAVFLGGPGAGYAYDAATIADFAAKLAHIASQGASFLITPSRRTPGALLAAADAATEHAPRILWRGLGENPYANFLAHADLLIVTADSVNMAGEACATGRPVYIFTPPGGRAKFRRFHATLEAHGATRPLPSPPSGLTTWTYEPLQSAERVAAEILARWRRFRSTMSRQ
ncbi:MULTISPECIES: mitochondrial fission ELM1 family protein [Rhodomicrobium]|uniref:mitochondrial fission ELM1 family protein n=1 Tax=Rhodomicrobium TaxID=1068 RepID=UPI0014835C17|nr:MULTISPECIES: mitochondrial fission ELM1 family protein [Rhodomicrobium]